MYSRWSDYPPRPTRLSENQTCASFCLPAHLPYRSPTHPAVLPVPFTVLFFLLLLQEKHHSSKQSGWLACTSHLLACSTRRGLVPLELLLPSLFAVCCSWLHIEPGWTSSPHQASSHHHPPHQGPGNSTTGGRQLGGFPPVLPTAPWRRRHRQGGRAGQSPGGFLACNAMQCNSSQARAAAADRFQPPLAGHRAVCAPRLLLSCLTLSVPSGASCCPCEWLKGLTGHAPGGWRVPSPISC